MTKYYFVSYINSNSGVATYGHCMVSVADTDLTGIAQLVQKANNFKTIPAILCLKDLSKDEYEMLKGGKDGEG